MDDQEYTFTCPRCGNDIKNKSRYCMNCGYLNPSHPSNKGYFKQYGHNSKEEYVVSQSGSFSASAVEKNSRGVDVSLSGNTGSFSLCFVINFVLYFLSLLLIGFYYYNQYSGNFTSILASNICLVLFAVSISFILEYSIQLIFMKMNRRWWLALIPLVNIYYLCEAVSEKPLFSIIVFIPVVGELYYIYILYTLGRSFKKSGLFTVLFPFIMFPVIGFGGSCFREVCYIHDQDSLEKEYAKKRVFLGLGSIVMLASIVLFLYSNLVSVDGKISRFNNYYLYYVSNKIISDTQKKVENGSYHCEKEDSSTMYFYFEDIGDSFDIPFYANVDHISAYVKVVTVPGEDDSKKYYISLSNSKYGYALTNADSLKLETIQNYSSLDFDEENEEACFLK